MDIKRCIKCLEEKPLSEFPSNKANKDGHTGRCRLCINKYTNQWRVKNPEKARQIRINYRKRYPWAQNLENAMQRCNNPKSRKYHRYGGRGIKCLITMQDIKYLWFRDKADNMERPSLDRIDNDENYTLDNCRFIELSENGSKGAN